MGGTKSKFQPPTLMVTREEGQMLRWWMKWWSRSLRLESSTVRLVMLHAGEQRVGGNGEMEEVVGFGSRVFWEIPVQVIWEGSVGQSQLGAENTCNNKMSQMN